MFHEEKDSSREFVLREIENNPLALKGKLLWVKYRTARGGISVALFYPEEIREEKNKLFSRYVKKGLDPSKISDKCNDIKQKILGWKNDWW